MSKNGITKQSNSADYTGLLQCAETSRKHNTDILLPNKVDKAKLMAKTWPFTQLTDRATLALAT